MPGSRWLLLLCLVLAVVPLQVSSASTPDPQPHQPCPSALHDQYVATGPDGKQYQTWHPQIDRVHGCYYEHEHGTNPALIDPSFHPLYGYTAGADGMSEAHTGFKGYGFIEADGSKWYLTQHQGTAGHTRICQQFHTLDVAVWNSQGQLLANVHLMGDFGKAVRFDGSDYVFKPAQCPNQGNVSGSGVRKILPREGRSYEPWRLNNEMAYPKVLGLNLNNVVFATVNPITVCADADCTNLAATGHTGANRFIEAPVGMTLKAGVNTGSFCTDPMARAVMPCGPGTVQQFIAPGASATATLVRNKCRDHDGYGALWWCDVGNPKWSSDADREHNLKSPN